MNKELQQLRLRQTVLQAELKALSIVIEACSVGLSVSEAITLTAKPTTVGWVPTSAEGVSEREQFYIDAEKDSCYKDNIITPEEC